jgi:DNA repair protein SbcC/Rad50
MIPVHLTLRNFLSYREPASLDFSTISVACLSGDNGAGKSALLDAITWALWGKCRANSDRDVISIGETEMDVTFCFQLADREYRVFRRRAFSPRQSQSVEFFVRELGDPEWLPITADSVRATEERIVETLNMEYDTFVNSAFILQGRADSFTQKPPGERKKILSDILNLQEYEQLRDDARAELRRVEDTLKHLQGRMESIDERLATRPQLVADLSATSAQLTEVSEKLELAQQLAQTLAQQRLAIERVRDTLTAARTRAGREQAALTSIAARLEERERERVELNDLLAHAEEIESGAAQHEHWRAVAAQCAATLQQVNRQIALQNAAEREIAQELNALTRQRDRNQQQHDTLRRQLADLDRDAARLAELRRESSAAGDTATLLATARATVEQRQHARTTLHTENLQLRARMNEISEFLATLRKGEADCPVCRRPLADGDREHVEATWQSEGKALGDLYRSNGTTIKEIDAALLTLQDDITQLEALDRANAARAGTIAQLSATLAQRAGLETQRDAAAAEVARIDAIISAQDFAHDARRRHADAEAALDELGYDVNLHDEATAGEAATARYVERKRALDQARTRMEAVEQAVADLLAQRTERQQAAQEAAAEIASLSEQLSDDPDIERRADEARDEAERLAAERDELWARQGGIEHSLAALDSSQAERDQLATQAKTLALDSGALRELETAFGRNGIQAMIIENVLPELEDEANELLRRMSSGQLRVSFRSQRQALSSDSVIETLDIIIRDEYGERPYQLYSGGEAFRVNFAVRVALSKLLAKRAGANIDMLVIDEGFGTQDSRGRDGLLEALRSVEDDFQKILVITHIGEVREMFPARIDVVKTDRGSRISIA